MKKVAVIGTSKIDVYLLGMREWPSVASERAPVESIQYHTGGNGLNVARHLAGMGRFEIRLFTAHGIHAQGRTVQAGFAYKRPVPHEHPSDPFTNGINATCPKHPGKLHTGLSFIHLDDEKEGQFATYTGVSKLITYDFLRPHIDEISHCDLLFYGGVGTSTGLSFREVADFFGRVRQGTNQPCIVADVNLVLARDQQGMDPIAQIAPVLFYVDYFVPNEMEALQYSGCSSVGEAAKKFNTNIRKAAIIKRGNRGVTLYVKNKQPVDVPQLPIKAKIMDTVGAGDAWCAGFIAHVLDDPNDIGAACLFGNKVAAFSILQIGATSNLHPFKWYKDPNNIP